MPHEDMDRVVPLGQLDDFRVAEGDPDVRGWEVRARDGRKIGEVDELLVDTGAMKVRYLDVDVDHGVLGDRQDRHVLIPIGYARLERDHDCVMVDAIASTDLSRIPAYGQGPLTRDFETSVRDSFGARGGESSRVTRTVYGADTAGSHAASSGPGSSGGMMTSGGMRAGASGGGPEDDVSITAGEGPAIGGTAHAHHGGDDFYADDAFDDDRFYARGTGGSPGGMGDVRTPAMDEQARDAIHRLVDDHRNRGVGDPGTY